MSEKKNLIVYTNCAELYTGFKQHRAACVEGTERSRSIRSIPEIISFAVTFLLQAAYHCTQHSCSLPPSYADHVLVLRAIIDLSKCTHVGIM